MKANRLNLCSAVRNSLLNAGYSTVKVVNAVNAELGKLKVETTGEKTGYSRALSKKTEFAVGVSQTGKVSGKMTVPLLFDVWHGKIEAAEKVAKFDHVAIPSLFNEWLVFAKADKAALDKEAAEMVPAGE